jgi:prepilin-type N-terminal cleavage/methylation domain-containing protein
LVLAFHPSRLKTTRAKIPFVPHGATAGTRRTSQLRGADRCNAPETGVNTIEVGVTRRKRRGLTMIEMVMVVVIIGIMAKVALPRFNIDRYRADGAGRLALILLQEAQRNAITRQSNVIVSFDSLYNRFRVVQDYNNNDTINTTDQIQFRKMAEGAMFAKPNWTAAVGVNGQAPTGAFTGSGLSTISGLPTVIFRRDGSASGDLTIFVTTRAAVATEYREIVVTASTGRSDLYKYNGTAWIRMN